MKPFLARELLDLNDCGCCEGISFQTPLDIANRSGLNELVYRVGTHSQFKQSMLAHLSNADLTALETLTTRDDDDFTIALIDAWAIVADVLTFYTERSAQELFLRTATERLSVRQLARLIGYQLRSGVSASTFLAFTLDSAPGSPSRITIDAGTKVQSIPGKDEQPQLFETSQAIEARINWNELRPRLTQPQTSASISKSVSVQGTATNIQKGDKLLIVTDSSQSFRTVFRVEVDQTSGITRLDLISGPPPAPPSFGNPTFPRSRFPSRRSSQFLIRLRRIFGQRLPQALIRLRILGRSWSQEDLLNLADRNSWSLEELANSVTAQLDMPAQPAQLYVFRLKASIFGHNAPQQVEYSGSNPVTTGGTLNYREWEPIDDEANFLIFLDNGYKEITPDSFLAIQTFPASIDSQSGTGSGFSGADVVFGQDLTATPIDPNGPTNETLIAGETTLSGEDSSDISIFRIEDAVERTRTAYGLSGKTTQITLNGDWWDHDSDDAFQKYIRPSIVYAQSEQLELVDIPIRDVVSGDTITLNGFYLGLLPGQKAILTGERDNLRGVTQSELLTLKDISIQSGYTQITLQKGLTYSYIRETVTINANVAEATHGETVQEVMGNGDASQDFQSFALLQPPLTHISTDSTPSGSLSTLEIRVNNILWQEAPFLYGQEPGDRVYTTRQTEEQTTVVQFGNGESGTRLPTGINNLQALYRKGIGFSGNLRPHQLTSLLTRPLGLKSVTNPLPATGGEDGESFAEARQNAPVTVLTLDRVVSLQDYEIFACAFGGIAKALATWTWMGQERGVFVTVAGPQGAAVGSKIIGNLISQYRQSGDPHVLVQVKTYRPAQFQIAGGVKVKPDFLTDLVFTAVKETLTEAFSFSARSFGQGVTLSEVIAQIQGVPGVDYIDLDLLKRKDLSINGLEKPLPAAVPEREGGYLQAAELLTLNPLSLNKLRELT